MTERETLKRWIGESDNVVFSVERVSLRRVEFLISEVRMDYIIRNMITRRKLF